MFPEYALEPAALTNWERVRYFLDSFGPWKGRFLAQYPSTWKKKVYESISCPDVERKRVFEKLRTLDRRVFSSRSHASYSGDLTWLENAKREHARVPFAAIIAAEAHSPDVLDAAEIDESCALWRVESGQLLERNASTLVKELEPLLRASSHVIIVEPYFRADRDEKTRILVALCRHLGGLPFSLEVHCSEKTVAYSECMRHAARALPNVLPSGVGVTLRCWRERPNGERLHNRYILTDVGGVKLGDSVEQGGAGQTDHVSILDEPSRRRLWEYFAGPGFAFDEAGVAQRFAGDGRS